MNKLKARGEQNVSITPARGGACNDAFCGMTHDEAGQVESLDIEDGSALLCCDEKVETATTTGDGTATTTIDDVKSNAFLQRPVFGAPLWAWAQIVAAVLAISTAGIAFNQLPSIPPLRLASWRMQATSLVLCVPACREWGNLDSELKTKTCSKTTLQKLVFSGSCLGTHFGLWVVSLQSTTLAHSLLLVTCTPLVLAFGGYFLGFAVSTGELVGAALGVAGVAAVASDAGTGHRGTQKMEHAATWQGDIISLGACVAIIGYMVMGRQLRQWMPLFAYAFPVTLVSAVFLAAASAVLERGAIELEGQPGSLKRDSASHSSYTLLGWFFHLEYLWVITYLALVPGLLGHTGYINVLKHVSPLVVSTSLTAEPLLGALIGFFVGVADAPGVATGVGGTLILLAVVAVIVASANREANG